MEFLVEGLAADPEFRGGSGPVVVVLPQHRSDQGRLGLARVPARLWVGLLAPAPSAAISSVAVSAVDSTVRAISFEVRIASGRSSSSITTRGQGDGPLDHVAQLADVAGPGVGEQGLHGRGGDAVDPAAVAGGVVGELRRASAGRTAMRSRSGGMSKATTLSR